MDVELTVRSLKGPLPGWRYHVLGSGTPTVAASDVETLKVPEQTEVTLRILPPAPKALSPAWRDDPTAYWPLDLPITWRGDQVSVGDPYHQVDVSRGSDGALRLSVVLSRVRDVSSMLEALGLKAAWPAEDTRRLCNYARQNGSRAAGLSPADLIGDDSKIVRVPALDAISSDDNLLLFEIAPPRRMVQNQEKLSLDFRPKLVGAYVGASVTTGSFLVYYYPQIDQDDMFVREGAKDNNLRRDSDDPDDARLDVNHYPNAFQHLNRVIFGKLFYRWDPWSTRGAFLGGLAHQVAASARPLAVVIPVPDLEPTMFADKGQTSLALGVAVSPEDLNEILREIWAYVQCLRLRSRYATDTAAAYQAEVRAVRTAANETTMFDVVKRALATAYDEAVSDSTKRPPVTDVRKNTSLDRTLVAAFSNGNHYLYQFTKRLAAMASPASLPFREFCALDPPSLYSAVEQTIRAACDKLPESRAYYYWKYAYDITTRENSNKRTLKAGPVSQTVLEGRFVYTHVPTAAWPTSPTNDADMHAWIDATMVCDAIKCSAFPLDPTKAVP